MECLPVTRYAQMAELVDHDVFKAFARIEREPCVYADPAGGRLAASPAAFHVPVCKLSGLDPENRLPFRHQSWRECFDGLAHFLQFSGRGCFCAHHGRRCDLFALALNPGAARTDQFGSNEVWGSKRDPCLDSAVWRKNMDADALAVASFDDPDFKIVDEYEPLLRHVREQCGHIAMIRDCVLLMAKNRGFDGIM